MDPLYALILCLFAMVVVALCVAVCLLAAKTPSALPPVDNESRRDLRPRIAPETSPDSPDRPA